MSSPPIDSRVAYNPLIRPCACLGSGYIRTTIDDITAWVFVDAFQIPDDPDPAAVEKHFHSPDVQALLARLANTFEEFFPITAEEWEAVLRHAPDPVLILQLWNTTADVFDYYTWGKKLPWGARADYFHLILRFFNSPGTALDNITFNALTPGRANRVVAEMGCYYSRNPW